jgi:rhodanese-related sulfurtransferase
MSKMARHRAFKDALYDEFARVGKALASPKRIELLDLLAQAPRTVQALAQEAAVSIAVASQHLQVLKDARLVEGTKEGLYVTYRIADAQVIALVRSMQAVGEKRLAEVSALTRDYFEERGALEPIDGGELKRRMREGAVTLIDVRPRKEFEAAHIEGAISVPVDELPQRLAELAKRKTVVAYCRGPYCVMAIEAVELLRKKGFRAERCEDGVVEWRARGGRVAQGSEAHS